MSSWHGVDLVYNNASAVGRLSNFHTWWESLITSGTSYGYHPNAGKTYLIVKRHCLESARKIFANSGITITSERWNVLGSPIGSPEFVHQFVSERVMDWVARVNKLSAIAIPYPQPAFAALVNGLCGKWTYMCLSCTCPGIEKVFQPLEDAIHFKFISSLTGKMFLVV